METKYIFVALGVVAFLCVISIFFSVNRTNNAPEDVSMKVIRQPLATIVLTESDAARITDYLHVRSHDTVGVQLDGSAWDVSISSPGGDSAGLSYKKVVSESPGKVTFVFNSTVDEYFDITFKNGSKTLVYKVVFDDPTSLSSS